MSFIIEATDLEHNIYELNKNGYLVDIYNDYSKTVNQLSFFKTSNSLTLCSCSFNGIRK